MALTRPLTDRELRALLTDSIDLTLKQARDTFASYRALEDETPNDPYAATLTNLLDAVFYLRFGGQWRATAAPHVFQPIPLDGGRHAPTRAPRLINGTDAAPSMLRNMSRALFGD